MLKTMNRMLLLAVAAAITLFAQANNIQISNSTLVGDAPADGFCKVRFDISWENSWRVSTAPNNWDAAWIFVKYRDINTGLWHHARLGSDAQHSAPAGRTIQTGLLTPGSAYNNGSNWGVGVFLYRSAVGTGTFSTTGVELRWNYSGNGINYGIIDEVKVFAIEMVYIPQGSFNLGSGGGEAGSFTNGSAVGSSFSIPFQINSESELYLAPFSGFLWSLHEGSLSMSMGAEGVLPSLYPKGYNGFYIMKHELSQKCYVDFINTLARDQQHNRTSSSINIGITTVPLNYVMSNSDNSMNRNGIKCNLNISPSSPIEFYCDLNQNGVANEPDDGQWLAFNYNSWMDHIAYLDWSGLRPMTELEYEKASRGPGLATPQDYAWGNTLIRYGDLTLVSNGSASEWISNAASNDHGNALFESASITPPGPVRVGIFCDQQSDRVSSGASYYGVLEMSGNLWERTVSLSDDLGRGYTATHGNGDLDVDGNANVMTWPMINPYGNGKRGGSFTDVYHHLMVSSRVNAGSQHTTNRYSNTGIRGIRNF